MNVVNFLLLLVSAVCFGLAAFTDVEVGEVNLVACGLLFFVAVSLIQAVRAL